MLKQKHSHSVVKLLIHARSGRTYITDREMFNTEYGLVRVKVGEQISSTGEKFLVTDPFFVDLWRRIRRGPQITHWKDLGLVSVLTGVGPGWRIVEAGSGSGFSTCFFAHIVGPSGHVYSYESNPRHMRIARENVAHCGYLDRVTFVDKDISKGIDQRDVDLVFLDLPEPWLVFEHALKALKPGGFLVCYVPSTDQVRRCIDAISDGFTPFGVYETFVRTWKTSPALRPENTGILHTAFVLVTRKAKK